MPSSAWLGPDGQAMRILLVANTLPPKDISGVGEQVLQLAAGLEELDHEVRVLGRAETIGGGKLLFPLAVVPALGRALSEFRPDAVQVHESDGGCALLLAAARRDLLTPRPRLVAALQVSYLEEFRAVRALRHGGRVLGRPSGRELAFKAFKAPLQVLLGWLSAYLADVVVAPSRRTADEIERDYGVESVGVLANVMGGREVEPREDASIGGERGYLLFVGRLRLRKGVEVLLESLAELGEACPRAYVVGDGEHERRLRRRATALGVGERVRFLGRREPGEIRFLMKRAGALVVPSIYEGMPLVILEAMQAALPVIASRVSGIPEVVRDGETGWLVPPEDPPALTDALREWLDDGSEARRRGEAGRRRLEDLFSARQAARAWLELVLDDETAAEAESAAPLGEMETTER